MIGYIHPEDAKVMFSSEELIGQALKEGAHVDADFRSSCERRGI